MTTLTALARTSTFLHPGPMRRGFLVGFFATLAAGLALLSLVSIAVGVAASGRIMPGVRVAGVPVGGLDRAAAEQRLRAELPSLTTGELTLTVDGSGVALPYADLGRGYRLDAMIDAAFAVARSGELASDAVARIRTLAQPASIAAVAASDEPGVFDRTIASLLARFRVNPVNASVAYDPAAGFAAVPGVDGAQLDASVLRAALLNAMERTDSASDSVTLSTTAVSPSVTTAAATRAAVEANRMSASALGLRAGGESHELAASALAGLISFEVAADGTYGPSIDRAALAALIQPLAAEVAREPQDAGFEWGVSGVTGVLPAVEGLELDVNRSVASVVEALRARSHALVRRSAALAVAVAAPALTTEAAQAAAPLMRRLSSWTTYYVPGEGNYWNANIHIAAWDLDKMVLAPDQWFSFWNDIGPVTFERGYGYGGAIIGGRSVANGAIAGGICSTSTTLFNTAMRAGLEIGDRMNHSYYIERYPMGLDATVLKTDTWAQDMTFRNDTTNPLVIRSYTGNGWVRFDIWGVPDGRTVSLSTPITSNHRAARETTVLNTALRPGTSVRVEYPHNGFDAVVTRVVRDADGGVIWTNTWTSHYRTVNGITEVGPEPAATPKPKPSATPAPSPSPA